VGTKRPSLRLSSAVLPWFAAFILGPAGTGSAGTVVCGYYPSFLRGTFPAESVRYETLTHVAHAFAWPEADGRLSMDADFQYPRLIERTHGAGRKILLSLGGWGQSSGFAPMAADPVTRAAFIRNVVRFCADHGYDGADIDWESPQNASDRSHLNLLVNEFRASLDAEKAGMLLTMAIPAGDWGGQWFDYAALESKVDWFGCMTYDFFGSWVSRAGHNAALYPPASNNIGSVHESVQYLTSDRQLQPGKILIGIPFYGRGCDAAGYGSANTGGNVEYAYSEIAPKTGQGWTYRWDRTAKVPYLLNQSMTKFISYDDTQSVRLKAGYAVNEGLGGMIIWALGQDMIGGNQLLLESAGRGLRSGSGADSEPIPVRLILLNAYPNPFNGWTLLAFDLDRPEHARLEVFNLMGELIRVVLDEDLAAGNHRVRFNGEGLDTGTYLYRLVTPSISKTGRMALLK
jgi:chitinase